MYEQILEPWGGLNARGAPGSGANHDPTAAEGVLVVMADLHDLNLARPIQVWQLGLWYWLAAALVFGFGASAFQLPNWGTAAVAFGVGVGVFVVEVLLKAVLPLRSEYSVGRPQVGPEFTFSVEANTVLVALPCFVYAGCLGLVGRTVWRGRSDFAGRIACYLTTALVPALLLVPVLLSDSTNELTKKPIVTPDGFPWACLAAAAAVAGLGFCFQSVANRVDALPHA